MKSDTEELKRKQRRNFYLKPPTPRNTDTGRPFGSGGSLGKGRSGGKAA